MKRYFIEQGILSLLILLTICSFANSEAATSVTSSPSHFSLPSVSKIGIEEKLSHATSDKEKIALLFDLANYYNDWEANAAAADSLLSKGIEIAESSYNNELLLQAYANYLMVTDDYTYNSKMQDIIGKLSPITTQLSRPQEVWKCKFALAKGYEFVFKLEDARDLAYQALTLAIQLDDAPTIIKTRLTLGDIQQKLNNNVEAVRNYLNALTMAEESPDFQLRMDCYHQLSYFYNLIKAYDKSIQYKLKEIELSENEEHPDSIRIMTLKFDLEVIAFNNRTVNEGLLYKILDYAERNHVEKLKKQGMVVFRNHLIKQNDFAQLYELFNTEFPEELDRIKKNDTTMYYRLSALFKEYKGDIDSATIYFALAATRINSSGDKLRKSSFYLRYGDFFRRNDLFENAIKEYRSAYLLASSMPYYEFMKEASSKLEEVFIGLNDYENAYKYGKLNRNISDSLADLQKREELQLLEIENEEILNQQQIEKAQEETRRRNNIQYTAITIIIVTAFLLLLILGGFNVHASLVRMLGFISFIFFFEFLILLFDTWIHHLTHGEPWKILAIKIILMAGLVPLHHLIEKKVTHYLISEQFDLKKKLFRFKKKKLETPILPDENA